MFSKSEKYISLKEAAQISGYSSDYIGWLIRKGEVKGKKSYTNISWQVLSADIIKYCKNKKNPGSRGFFLFKKRYLSLKEAARLSGYAPDYIGWLIREKKIIGKKVYSGVTWLITEEAIKKYQEKFNRPALNGRGSRLVSDESEWATNFIERQKQKGKINQSIKLIYDIFPPIQKKVSYWIRVIRLFLKTSKYAAVLTFLFVIICGALIVWAVPSEAPTPTIKIYPTQCQGGWENPQNAQGEPDLSEGAELQEFNEENSAMLRNSISQILCKGFEGEIPDETKIKKVSLKFSWTFKKEIPEFFVPAPAPSEDNSIPEEISPEEGLKEETENENLEPVIEPEPNPEISPAPSSENGSESLPESPSSWRKIISYAFAQEDEQISEENIEINTEDSQANPEEEQIPEIEEPPTNKKTEVQPAPEEPNSQEEELTPQEAEEKPIENITSDAFLEVLYTFDGVNWQSLGKVNNNNWQNLSLEIPVVKEDKSSFSATELSRSESEDEKEARLFDFAAARVSDWEDLGKIQIKIQSLMVFDDQPTVYLDGLWIEVEYEKLSGDEELSPEEIAKLPRVEIEKEKVFKFSKKDFQANEEPGFEIDFTSLEAEYLKIEETESLPLPEIIPASEPEPEVVPTQEEVESPEITPEPIPEPELEPEPQNIETENSSSSSFLDNIYKLLGIEKVHAKTPKIKVLNVIVFDNTGKDINTLPIVEEIDGKTKIRIPKPEGNFRPGKYQLQIEILIGKKVFISVQEFTWGVLAINTNKSIFLPGEAAYLQMAVLNDAGHTICNANLRLEITPPSGDPLREQFSQDIEVLTTENGTIHYSDTCGANNVTDNPDYFAYLRVGELGEYQMKLKNLDNGYEITDSFEVQESVPFEVERVGATRINPFKASYVMTIKIKANQDFEGEIIESVPDSFAIVETSDMRQETRNGKKLIIWEKNLKEGETIELKYEYQAPKVSPEIYFLGPLEFSVDRNWFQKLIGPDEKIIFKEARQWQIAADATNIYLFWAGSGGSCAGAGAPPTGWTLVSDGSFTATFPRGDSSYTANESGATTHTHTVSGSNVAASSATRTANTTGGDNNASYLHTHTLSGTSVGTSSSVPSYKDLCVITLSAGGIPSGSTAIPQNAIAIFDNTVPSGWNDYSGTFGTYYIRGDTGPGDTGGSNTHATPGHTVSATLDAPGGTIKDTTGTGALGSLGSHTHTVSSSTVDTPSIEPLSQNIILGQKTGSDGPIPGNMIAMFNGDPGTSWTIGSNNGGDFYLKYLKVTGAYGNNSSGATTHAHSQIRGDSSSYTADQVTGTAVGTLITTHTHPMTVDLNTGDNLPPYTDVIIAKKNAITISGTADDSVGKTVKVAIDNLLQEQSAIILSATPNTWQITGVAQPSSGAVITVWIDDALDPSESTGVTNYAGSGNVSGMVLNANVLSIGSDGSQSTSAANLYSYTCLNDEDVMHSVATGASYNLSVQGAGCFGAVNNSYDNEKIDILATDTLTLAGDDSLTTDNLTIDGTLTSGGASAYYISGSWDNNATFTASNSTATFTATSGTETIDSTGGLDPFYNLVLGSGSGTATWNLASALNVDGNLTIAYGTLAENGASNNVNLAGSLDIQANGNFSQNASATFTFDGAEGIPTYWGNTGSQDDIGNVLIDGAGAFALILSSSVTATKISVIDTLSLGSSGYTLTITGSGTGLNMPFTVAGTLTEGTDSLVKFTGTSDVDVEDETYDNLQLSPSGGSGPTYTLGHAASPGTITTDALTIGNGVNAVVVDGTNYDPPLTVAGNFSISASATFTASNSATFNVGGNWLTTGTFNHDSGTVTFDASTTGKTINSGGTGTGKDFNKIVFNSATGGWTIGTNNLTALSDFTITNVNNSAAGFIVNSVILEVRGTYSIVDTETAYTTWTSATLYLNSASAYSISTTKLQAPESFSTLQIGNDTDIRMWNSGASAFSVSSSGSLYSMDADYDNDGDADDGYLYIWGDYHVNGPSNTDYWSYALDFDAAVVTRQVNVRIDPAATVTVDNLDTLNAIGTSPNRTTVSRQGASGGYGIVVASGGVINFQYTNFDYLEGTGIDIANGATVTSLDNTAYDNMVATAGVDAFITVAYEVIGSVPKTISNVSILNTGGGANCNVNRTAGSDPTGYWDFDAHNAGGFAGEDYDCVAGANEDDPGMLRWDDSTSFVPSISYELSTLSLSLGNINPTNVVSNSHTSSVTTNAPNGYVLYISEDDNLRDGLGDDIDDIELPDTEITAGNEEYGLATSDSGQQIIQDTDCPTPPYYASAITPSVQTVASASGIVTDEETTFCYAAAVDTSTIPGYYSHIVTIVVTGKF